MTKEQRETIENQIESHRSIIEDLLTEICYHENEIKNLETLLNDDSKIDDADIITNSSSEVFIARNLKSKNQEIIELIQNVAKAANLDLDEILEFEIASEDERIDSRIKCRKGDLLIWSADDNSIPYWLMEFISSLDYDNISRYHLG